MSVQVSEKLTLYFDDFTEDNFKVMTVVRGDEALQMFYDKQVEFIRDILLGDIPITEVRERFLGIY